MFIIICFARGAVVVGIRTLCCIQNKNHTNCQLVVLFAGACLCPLIDCQTHAASVELKGFSTAEPSLAAADYTCM